MIPTLMGRWQTRLAMLGTWGALVTLLFALSYNGFNNDFFWVLGYVAAFGLVWDVIWILVQRLRWDRDWPAAFQWATAAIEGLLVYLLIDNFGLPGVKEGVTPRDIFAAHYGTVFIVTYLWVQGPMRALYPRWRFTGGRVI